MTKLWARLYLWWHGWCPKHLIEKTHSLPDECYCPMCEEEDWASTNRRTKRAVEILRGKQG